MDGQRSNAPWICKLLHQKRMDDGGGILLLAAPSICAWTEEESGRIPCRVVPDGHRSHVNIAISEICAEHDIILICFPPNSTHILQPCDVAFFKPFKGLWREKVNEWTSKRPQNQVTIKNIAHLLHDVWQKLPLKYGQNGFRACGLYPWDPKAVR